MFMLFLRATEFNTAFLVGCHESPAYQRMRGYLYSVSAAG